jgi:hypothetical protein
LREDCFGNVDAWVRKLFCEVGDAVTGFALALMKTGARDEMRTYGVPTAYAPLSIPAQNTKPLLLHPVWFAHSSQTKLLLACPLPPTLVAGMIAHTMIVIKHPARIRNSPMFVSVGRARFANMTTAHAVQVISRYATNTCHLSYAYSG